MPTPSDTFVNECPELALRVMNMQVPPMFAANSPPTPSFDLAILKLRQAMKEAASEEVTDDFEKLMLEVLDLAGELCIHTIYRATTPCNVHDLAVLRLEMRDRAIDKLIDSIRFAAKGLTLKNPYDQEQMW